MKVKTRILLSLILMSLISVSSYGQTTDSDEMLKNRVAEKVALMNSYVKFMAAKSNPHKTRQYYSKKALPLFIGKGDSYILDGVNHDGVMMQTTSTNTNSVTSQLMKNYFQHLIDLKYSDVKITSTSAADMKVSDLKKIAPGKYVCTCQYVQYFYGYKDGQLVYKDRTTKRIECLVEFEETEDGQECIVRLGDVEAIHTEKI